MLMYKEYRIIPNGCISYNMIKKRYMKWYIIKSPQENELKELAFGITDAKRIIDEDIIKT